MNARIQVDDHLQRLARRARGLPQGGDVGGVVDHGHQVARLAIQHDQPGDGRRRDHRRGDQQAGRHPALGQGLGFADLGAAQAHGAGGDLQLGDVDALVGLGVRPQLDALARREVRHARDVALQGRLVDHQHRGVEFAARAGAPIRPACRSWSVMALARIRGRRVSSGEHWRTCRSDPRSCRRPRSRQRADRAGGHRPSSGCGAWPSAGGPRRRSARPPSP